MEEIKKLYEDLLPWERVEFCEWVMEKIGIMLLVDCTEEIADKDEKDGVKKFLQHFCDINNIEREVI